MKCIVLQNADGGHLGFMLCSPGLDQPSGDCVFMPLPAQPDLFGTAAVEPLFARREAGESAWEATGRDPLSVVVRTPGHAAELFIELDGAGVGHWGTGSGASRQVLGRALLANRDEEFIEAILTTRDRALRLIYADWLDERGDPRGQLVRVEEEMRQVPIYSDRYWELKPWRNALRKQCDKTWLQKMGYGTNYEPVFGDMPDGWKERWRLLREFTERWHGIPMPDVGGQAKEIEATEKQLQRELPPSVREWIAYCIDLGDNFIDVLRDCPEFVDLPELSAISLMFSGEGDLCWAVKKANLWMADPPVEKHRLDYDSQPRQFVEEGRYTPRVTSFVFRHMDYFLFGNHGKFESDFREYLDRWLDPAGL